MERPLSEEASCRQLSSSSPAGTEFRCTLLALSDRVLFRNLLLSSDGRLGSENVLPSSSARPCRPVLLLRRNIAGGGGRGARPHRRHRIPVTFPSFHLLNFCAIFIAQRLMCLRASMAKRYRLHLGPCHKSQPLSQWQRRAGDGRSRPRRCRPAVGVGGKLGPGTRRPDRAPEGCRVVRHSPLHTSALRGLTPGRNRQPEVGERVTLMGTL